MIDLAQLPSVEVCSLASFRLTSAPDHHLVSEVLVALLQMFLYVSFSVQVSLLQLQEHIPPVLVAAARQPLVPSHPAPLSSWLLGLDELS